jgi:multidrug efflux system outer membrane protein
MMASQHAQVRVAYANYFPQITLAGTIGYFSPDISHFLKWQSRFWSLGAQAVQTAFDGGRTDYLLTAAWAQFNAADAAYKQTVLAALEEVEDAISSITMLEYEAIKLAESVDAAKTTAKIASDRYFQGVTFYLDVMDSQRDELTAERSYIALQGQRYIATIQLIKALGGAW